MIEPGASNPKPVGVQVSNEAADLGTRTVYNGRVAILLPSNAWAERTRIFALDTLSYWEIVQDPVGTHVAYLLSDTPSQVSTLVIPPPRIRLDSNTPKKGFFRDGTSSFAYGTVIASVCDVPNALLTNPLYQFRLELLRHVPKRRRRTFSQPLSSYVNRPMYGGFYHPTNWVGGVAPVAIGGTRGGSQTNVSVDRPTQWSLLGFSQNQQLALPCAEVMMPYFNLVRVDDAFGGSIVAATYYMSGKRSGRRGVVSYNRLPLGVFAFRYAAYDIGNGLLVSGPMSVPVYVRPQKWPVRRRGDFTTYPHNREVNPATPTDTNTGGSPYQQLVTSLGRVSDRYYI